MSLATPEKRNACWRWLIWACFGLLVTVLLAVSGPAQPVPAQLGDPLYVPFDGVRWARKDLEELCLNEPLTDLSYIRYLFGGHLTRKERQAKWAWASVILNSLSVKNVSIVPPTLVDGTDSTLIRVNLLRYDIDPKIWDRLAELGSGRSPFPDPYFQQAVQDIRVPSKPAEEIIVGYDVRGQPIRQKKAIGATDKRTIVLKPARWLTDRFKEKNKKGEPDPGQNISRIIELTNTKHPILRTDWFITYASWAPRYYEFLGLNAKSKRDDFERIIGLKPGSVKIGGIVVKSARKSQVALNNRFITYEPTGNSPLDAAYYETHDSKISIADRDYLNVILDLLKNDKNFFDATENIGTLRNKMQAYWLGNGNGDQLDKADPDIAIDLLTRLMDKQVWAGRNCMTCHSKGIKDISDRVRALSVDKMRLLVVNDDNKETNLRLISDTFGYPLDKIVSNSQRAYDEAIRHATAGRSALQFATGLETTYYEYLDVGLDIQAVSREVGMPVGPLLRALKRGIGISHPLTGLLEEVPEEIRRDQWEAGVFAELMEFLDTYREAPQPGGPSQEEKRKGK